MSDIERLARHYETQHWILLGKKDFATGMLCCPPNYRQWARCAYLSGYYGH